MADQRDRVQKIVMKDQVHTTQCFPYHYVFVGKETITAIPFSELRSKRWKRVARAVGDAITAIMKNE